MRNSLILTVSHLQCQLQPMGFFFSTFLISSYMFIRVPTTLSLGLINLLIELRETCLLFAVLVTKDEEMHWAKHMGRSVGLPCPVGVPLSESLHMFSCLEVHPSSFLLDFYEGFVIYGWLNHWALVINFTWKILIFSSCFVFPVTISSHKAARGWQATSSHLINIIKRYSTLKIPRIRKDQMYFMMYFCGSGYTKLINM